MKILPPHMGFFSLLLERTDRDCSICTADWSMKAELATKSFAKLGRRINSESSFFSAAPRCHGQIRCMTWSGFANNKDLELTPAVKSLPRASWTRYEAF